MLDPNWVTIAILGKPRGNRGELTAISLSDHPERFQTLEHVHLFGSGSSYVIEEVWNHQSTLIFKFAGIDSISEAETLSGSEVRVPFAQRAPLEAGEFYHSDLIGCQVHDRTTGRIVGEVTGFEDGGATGLLQLGPQILIPFTKDICVVIDPAQKRIEAILPEGLLDLKSVTFHLVTIFPDFFTGPFQHGVVARAAQAGLIQIKIHNLRDWTHDRHQTVDDRPFGGGEGMVLKPAPLFDAIETILPQRTPQTRVILTSAAGKSFDQSDARRLAAYAEIVLICGRYEGVDQRVGDHLADEQLSIGNFVLSGGELAAAVILDATARLLPGVLGNADSSVNESFSTPEARDCPQYTRPADFRGWRVPEVLLNGNHEEIKKWRQTTGKRN